MVILLSLVISSTSVISSIRLTWNLKAIYVVFSFYKHKMWPGSLSLYPIFSITHPITWSPILSLRFRLFIISLEFGQTWAALFSEISSYSVTSCFPSFTVRMKIKYKCNFYDLRLTNLTHEINFIENQFWDNCNCLHKKTYINNIWYC